MGALADDVGKTAQHAPPPTKLAKGQYVKGIVVSVDDQQASVSVKVDSEEILTQLSFRNYTKSKTAIENASKGSYLAVGEKIWACVLQEGPVPQLSTAALEATPGSMLHNKPKLFSALDQWASESDTLPYDDNGKKFASFRDWRGEKELNAFLESGRKRGRETQKIPSKQLLPPEAASLVEWNPEKDLSEGDIVMGAIGSILPFGVFVKVPGLANDALIPIAQISKVRTDHTELMEGSPPLFARGEEIVAVVHTIEEDRGQKSNADEEGEALEDKRQVPAGGVGGLRFVLSTRVLEGDEDGAIRKSLKEYNTHALEVHRKYNLELALRNIAASNKSLELFSEDTENWRSSGIEVPIGSIVQGKITRIQSCGAFVKLDNGPTVLLHKGAISDAKVLPKGGALSVFNVGDVIYGTLHNRPMNTPPDVSKSQEMTSELSSPSDLWLSLKKFENKGSVGKIFSNQEEFWKAAKAKFVAQSIESTPRPHGQVSTMLMHANNLDVRGLKAAIRSLQWVQWEGLLESHDRWPPSLSTIIWADQSGLGLKSSSTIALQYMKLQPELAQEVRREYCNAITQIQNSMETLVAKSLQPLISSCDSSLFVQHVQDPEQPWLKETIRPEVRHAWMTSNQSIRKAIERISLLRVKSSLVNLLGGSNKDEDQVAAMRSEAEQAAANAVIVAELLLSSSNAEASGALLSELLPLLRSFPATDQSAGFLPVPVAERLIVLGWNLIASKGDLGGGKSLRSSLVVEVLALSSFHPPLEWCDAAFKLMYKSMLFSSDSSEMIRFFRLMKALGYRPPGFSWWDRTLQQIYYNQKRDKIKPFVIDELRSVIGALLK